jgi:amino-acid N-acetyltransferase
MSATALPINPDGMNARLDPAVRCTPATPEQLPAIVRLLSEADLPADDLSSARLGGFEAAVDDAGRVVGVAGIELLGRAALLRSLAVAPEWRGRGIAKALVDRRESAARAAGVGAIYLLTTSARDFFLRHGYTDITREAVPPTVAAHAQFRSVCPLSAKCLGKQLR